MAKKIGFSLLVIILVFLGYVSSRPGAFRYERSGVINASADKIFPYITDFKKGKAWSPYELKDPNMKETYGGFDGQVGSIMEFEGNKEVGSGKLEILKIVPNQAVQIKLTMTKPMNAENIIDYTLTPEGSGTRFSWAMSGDCGFFGKLISVFINCEKMVGDEFNAGIANLKKLIETQPN